jgi:hypothetical protein
MIQRPDGHILPAPGTIAHAARITKMRHTRSDIPAPLYVLVWDALRSAAWRFLRYNAQTDEPDDWPTAVAVWGLILGVGLIAFVLWLLPW